MLCPAVTCFAMLCRAVSCCAMLCPVAFLQCAVSCCVMTRHAVPYCMILYHAVPCFAMPCNAVPCREIMPSCVMLCHSISCRCQNAEAQIRQRLQESLEPEQAADYLPLVNYYLAGTGSNATAVMKTALELDFMEASRQLALAGSGLRPTVCLHLHWIT